MQLPPGAYVVKRSLPGESGGGELVAAIWVTNGTRTWLITRDFGRGATQSQLPEAGATFVFNPATDDAIIAEEPRR